MADEIVSQASLARFKPRATPYEVSVRDVPPLKLVVRPSGTHSWIVRKRLRGEQLKFTIGEESAISLDVAMEEARAALALIKKGINPNEVKKAKAVGPVTFGTVAEQWMTTRMAQQRRSVAQVQRVLDHDLLPSLADKPIADVTLADVAKCVRVVQTRGSAGVARQVWSTCTALMNWAVTNGILKASPLAGVRGVADPVPPRERWLNPEELRDVWQATATLGEPHASVVKLLILTGAREMEIAALEWSEIDRSEGLIRLPGPRTKRTKPKHYNIGRDIPLSSAMLAVLDQVQPTTDPDGKRSPFVFPKTNGKPEYRWGYPKEKIDRAIAERREAEGRPPMLGWWWHDLRRSLGTLMARDLRQSVAVIEAAIGHLRPGAASSSIVGVYQKHSYAAEAAAALEAWGRYITALVEDTNVVPLIRDHEEPVDERIPPSYRGLGSKVVMREDGGGAGFVIGGSRPVRKP